MKRTTLAAFWTSPVGRCVVGRNHCVGCWDETLRFAALWGRPDEQDVRAFIALLEVAFHPALRSPLLALTDVSRLEAADPAAFRVLTDYLSSRNADFDRVLDRHALIRPREGFVAALAGGFYGALGAKRPVASFTSGAEGVGWLDRSKNAEAIAAALAQLLDESAGADLLLSGLRRLLDEEPRTSLETTAKALGMTGRGLQRHLEGLTPRRGFREEVAAAKLRLAERLIVGADLKIASVASRVGLSQAKLRRLVRATYGATPAALRSQRPPDPGRD